ncbi:SDR family NAD(P)-dependent oxidoreductase [Candidatus Woesearchaeota archaeon]|jgi:UDP-glucuronate 4-epimerase|nr:SDR family NAD(P)-dependent oxidoreductase [Candidatus Woesearchaeota archaeon]MBT7062458.1 SDR family NAD(P)-dependent oxidoreductase [Candidatus Woesearchaeota archaeon]MBT7402891.1 SDR family NAD(P)-dependent oxidoreductase [Candidatus Woesearchaeota archaeon]
MKVLVTGGAGFIGFHTTKALLERGDEVIIVDNFNDYYDVSFKENRINQIKDNKNLKIYRIDISDYKEMEKIFQENKFDKICHLAAQAGVRYSLDHPFVYEKANLLGTLVLLELARHHKVKDFVFASSSSVYGGNKTIPFSETDNVDTPISLYAATKKSDELMAYCYHHLYGINCTGLRFFTVYGPWGRPDMALFLFTKAILEEKPMDVFNYGKMKRDFTYIDDIVAGLLACLDKPFGYEIFNLGNNKTVELLYFIETIEKELGKKGEKNLLPMQAGDIAETFANIDKAKKMLGFNPKVSIEQGIKNFIQWYKEYNKTT